MVEPDELGAVQMYAVGKVGPGGAKPVRVWSENTPVKAKIFNVKAIPCFFFSGPRPGVLPLHPPAFGGL